MIDDILLQENQSLKEQLKIAIEMIRKFYPELDVPKFMHDIATCDFEEYLYYCEHPEEYDKEERARYSRKDIKTCRHDVDYSLPK